MQAWQTRHAAVPQVAQARLGSSHSPIALQPGTQWGTGSKKRHTSPGAQSSCASHCPGGAGTQADLQSSHAGQLDVAHSSQICPFGHGGVNPHSMLHVPVAKTQTPPGQSSCDWHAGPVGVGVVVVPVVLVVVPVEPPLPPDPPPPVITLPPHPTARIKPAPRSHPRKTGGTREGEFGEKGCCMGQDYHFPPDARGDPARSRPSRSTGTVAILLPLSRIVASPARAHDAGS